MTDTQILIANYQSIIRVLVSQVRTLELQINGDAAGCALLPDECIAVDALIMDFLIGYEFAREHGVDELSSLLSAWEKIRKGRAQND